jgi:hypothetical protein
VIGAPVLAYSSNESGRIEVYVRPFPGPAGRFTVSTDGGEMPVWSKDGRRLFYVRRETTLMAVEVASGASFSASAPRAVMVSDNLTANAAGSFAGRTRNFDVARDGRILVVREPGGRVADRAHPCHPELYRGAQSRRPSGESLIPNP